MSGSLRALLQAGRQGRTSALLVARVVEQAALGIGSLLLARRLGLDGYAPLAAVTIVNSFAVSLSDYGLGLAVMSSPLRATGAHLMTRVRMGNGLLILAVAVAAAFIEGDVRIVIVGGAVLWAVAAEGYVRKAALIRQGRTRQVARAEILGSLVFAASVALALAWPSHALILTTAGLVAKHVVESLLSWGWRQAFSPTGGTVPMISVWATQALAYASANVDFLIVGVVISSEAFSVYSLGFRLAAVVTAQVSYAVQRVMLVDFAEATDRGQRQRVLDRRFRQLFGVGIGGAVVIALGAPLAPLVLGGSWKPIVGVVLVLAVGVPWRMVLSVSGTMAMGSGLVRSLVVWESGRAIVTTVVLLGAAYGGFPWFVGASSAVAILTSCAVYVLVVRSTDLRPWRGLLPLSTFVAAAAVVAGWVLVRTPR